MGTFKELTSKEFNINPFEKIGKEWMLVASEHEGKVNAMTASWGGLGIMWNRNVAYVVIRKSRYTKELVDGSKLFSLTFFKRPEYDKMLGYMGSKSGRNEDKIEKMGLTVNREAGVPYFEEAELVLVCRAMLHQPLLADSFLDESLDSNYYSDKDYHELYIAEIVKIMEK